MGHDDNVRVSGHNVVCRHPQNMQPLTIASDPGRSRPAESIPASQGLLTTVAPVPHSLPPSGSAQNIPALIPPHRISARPEGLRLLQLPPAQRALLRPPHPGPVREAWAPQHPISYPPPPPHLSAHRWSERASGVPEVSRQEDWGPRLLPTPQHAAPAPAPAPVRGLPLLHLRPGSSSLPVSLPVIPQPIPIPAPAPLLTPAGMGPFPRLQLLQRGLDPPSTVGNCHRTSQLQLS